MRDDIGGRGPVIAGCPDYRHRFQTQEQALHWCARVDEMGNCLHQHIVLLDETEAAVQR